MNPQRTEREKRQLKLTEAILEGIKVIKDYDLEIIKGQREIREDLRNLDNLRSLKK